MVGVAPILFILWKLIKRTKFVKPHEADLVWDRPVIDAYEETFYGPPSSFWKEMLSVSFPLRKLLPATPTPETDHPPSHRSSPSVFLASSLTPTCGITA